jgi:hypothetical protein
VEQFSVPLRGLTPDEDDWYFIGSGPSDDRETITYSSLIGLYVSTKGSRGGVNHFFNIETSYLYSDCSLKKSDDPVSKLIWEKESEGSYKNKNGTGVGLALDIDAEFNVSNPSTAPRKIWFGSFFARDHTIECSMTTTYVEVKVACDTTACAATAIRRSKLQHEPATTTWLDGGPIRSDPGGPPEPLRHFCSGFISATKINLYQNSILEHYLLDPYNSFIGSPQSSPGFEGLLNTELSARFTQLFNSFVLASASPYTYSSLGYIRERDEWAVNITAIAQIPDDHLHYNPTWLAVLVASLLVMCAAGIATVVLNLKRRGPEVMDSFTSLLKDNPYVSEETGPSTEDSLEKVRHLRKTRAVLGDVRPLEATGYIAVTTRTDGEGVQRLRSGRLYR